MCAPIRLSFVLTASLVLIGQTGCALQEQWAGVWHDTKRLATPDPTDRRDSTENPDQDWSFVGDEGRAGQEVTTDPDQWYRKYIMSEKARQIEENLGFE